MAMPARVSPHDTCQPLRRSPRELGGPWRYPVSECAPPRTPAGGAMKKWFVGGLMAVCAALSGCTVMCWPDCARQSHVASSSSLVAFLYPHGTPPAGDAIPELQVPLRVGLAFLPTRGEVNTLDAAHQDQLLEQVRARFAGRKFISQIVIIPDYYLSDRGLAGRSGFEGLEGVQR